MTTEFFQIAVLVLLGLIIGYLGDIRRHICTSNDLLGLIAKRLRKED